MKRRRDRMLTASAEVALPFAELLVLTPYTNWKIRLLDKLLFILEGGEFPKKEKARTAAKPPSFLKMK